VTLEQFLILERWINAVAGARDYPLPFTVAFLEQIREEAKEKLVDPTP
jgi:hypothetical protein